MAHEGMVPFVHFFPQQGVAETRTLIIRGDSTVPDGEYGLLELYCVEPGCDCRRVLISVMGRQQQKSVASISYAFDRDDEWAGPFLDPLNPQSRYANTLLNLVTQVLADPAYVARLEAHYQQVKAAVSDPAYPSRKRLAARNAQGWTTRPARTRPRRWGRR
jgi:hypothetical protein